MRVISREPLKVFSRKHPQSETPLDTWYRVAKQAHWNDITEVWKTYPSASLVGKYIIFNIKGNDYRLIVSINFNSQIIYIDEVCTHANYSKERWKT